MAAKEYSYIARSEYEFLPLLQCSQVNSCKKIINSLPHNPDF